jgi:exosortase
MKKRASDRLSLRQKPAKVVTAEEPKPLPASVARPVEQGELLPRYFVGFAALAAGTWAYWPTLGELVATWEREPDYSHGYLVLPAALFFLWARRETMPTVTSPGWLSGVLLVALSFGVRLFAGAFYFESIDGWSLLLWLAGVVALLFGNRLLVWSLPSIAFLFFAVPLPFRLEGLMSLPLQRVATKLSCWLLQLVGQPAISEGNTILMGDHRLEVAQACSGLRLFMSISALAFAYLLLVKRSWWEKALLIVSIIPIAVLANAARIVATGLLFEFASEEIGHQFSHDFAGWAMIPLAATLFGVVLWYLGKLFREQEQMALKEVIRQMEV